MKGLEKVEKNNRNKWLTHRKQAEQFKKKKLFNMAQYHYHQAILHFHAMKLEEERMKVNEIG